MGNLQTDTCRGDFPGGRSGALLSIVACQAPEVASLFTVSVGLGRVARHVLLDEPRRCFDTTHGRRLLHSNCLRPPPSSDPGSVCPLMDTALAKSLTG